MDHQLSAGSELGQCVDVPAPVDFEEQHEVGCNPVRTHRDRSPWRTAWAPPHAKHSIRNPAGRLAAGGEGQSAPADPAPGGAEQRVHATSDQHMLEDTPGTADRRTQTQLRAGGEAGLLPLAQVESSTSKQAPARHRHDDLLNGRELGTPTGAHCQVGRITEPHLIPHQGCAAKLCTGLQCRDPRFLPGFLGVDGEVVDQAAFPRPQSRPAPLLQERRCHLIAQLRSFQLADLAVA